MSHFKKVKRLAGCVISLKLLRCNNNKLNLSKILRFYIFCLWFWKITLIGKYFVIVFSIGGNFRRLNQFCVADRYCKVYDILVTLVSLFYSWLYKVCTTLLRLKIKQNRGGKASLFADNLSRKNLLFSFSWSDFPIKTRVLSI